MKVIALNGSPRLVGNTSNSLNVLLDELNKEGIETEYVQVYEDHMNPCNYCSSCEVRGDGRCIAEDDRMNEYLDRMSQADGIILASPVFFGSCTAQLKMFLERAGYCSIMGGCRLKGKVGAVMTVQSREGGEAVYSELVSWMLANQMVVVGSNPLPIITARDPTDFEKDAAGMKALKCLGKNMAEALMKMK